ncbi:hypothetical protein DFH11DRAFT_945702 [Phellopilus nigrolimitatus]|nr:hypothetical protein DFH11DRAFT_945702 [Phellopilus nigrolimitatus]
MMPLHSVRTRAPATRAPGDFRGSSDASLYGPPAGVPCERNPGRRHAPTAPSCAVPVYTLQDALRTVVVTASAEMETQARPGRQNIPRGVQVRINNAAYSGLKTFCGAAAEIPAARVRRHHEAWRRSTTSPTRAPHWRRNTTLGETDVAGRALTSAARGGIQRPPMVVLCSCAAEHTSGAPGAPGHAAKRRMLSPRTAPLSRTRAKPQTISRQMQFAMQPSFKAVEDI